MLKLKSIYYKRRSVIHKVLEQQKQMFETGKSCKDRLVSISKSYVRPIVRGKENRAIEFGAKANLIQIDEINFIEHISFNAFNKDTWGISSIGYAQLLMRKKVTHFAADAIYANKTCKYCSSRPSPIYTSFIRKGRKAKERSTRLEGSFGTEKEHYNLRKNQSTKPKKPRCFGFFLAFIQLMQPGKEKYRL